MTLRTPQIAVLIPCYNEAAAITMVVRNFQAALPDARIYVYDNNSVDQTVDRARAAGAIVRRERQQGKGHVVRRMFGDVEADVYVLVDGDGTYDAASAPRLVQHLLNEQLDMVNAARVEIEKVAYRPGHRFGNVLLTRMVGLIFGDQIKDMLSGYRVFSRRFVKSFPALSTGFEIETELTVHALELHMPIAEMQTSYRARPAGSLSKLHTFRDGFRILATIALLVRDERPLPFFSVLFALLTMVSVVLAWPIVLEFMVTGLVPRFPTAILSTGLVLLAFLSLACGIILDTVTLGRREIKRLHYLGISGTASELDD
ncbi:MAG TPA: glycosyltransferase [Candidatus Competibacteraceae bacterium]|nr:glycosyltransferase [Candidatus Competibacteraceae bacterium]